MQGKNLSDNIDIPIALKKVIRTCTRHPISHFISYEKLSPRYRAFTTDLSEKEIPKNIQEALETPEFHALKKNETWELPDLPEGKQLVECKWIFNVK